MNKSTLGMRVLIFTAFLIIVNIISSFINGYVDLTEDKRFTITEPTKEVVRSLDEIVYIKVLLEGDFPAGFKRLQTSTKTLLEELRDINPNIQYIFENPMEGTTDQKIARRDELAKDGIIPTSLQYYDGEETVNKPIYPYAVLNLGANKIAIPLLESQKLGVDENIILNNSVSLLEYKFADALQKLQQPKRKNIIFTSGNGEMLLQQTYSLEKHLRRYYNTGRLNLDSVLQVDPLVDMLIIAAPRQEVDIKNQFKIDQFIMNGGKVIWMIEKLDSDLDSIAQYEFYVPKDINTGLDELLFKYGVRVQPNLIMDLECTRIPQRVGMQGDKPQFQLFPWPYHPAIAPTSTHPIVKNLDRINMSFPSSIDTLKTDGQVNKTILLSTSKYSRKQFNPVRLNFEILKTPFDPDKFDEGPQPVAVLLEGQFDSAFKNRMTPSFQATLDQLSMEFKPSSVPTKQLIISDADFTKSLFNNRTEKPEEIGFNKWENQYFKGNKDFIINAVEYLLDEKGVLQARSKDIKLRLLDKVRTKQEKGFWQFFNIGLPLIFILIFGLVFYFIRKHKYTT